MEIGLQQSTTADENSLLVMSYLGWSVDDPKEFFPKFERGSLVAAEGKLKEMLLNAQKQVMGKHRLQDLISLDPSQLKFVQIEQERLLVLHTKSNKHNSGIDVQFVHIKRLGLPEGTTTAVLDRMSAERRQLVTKIKAEGDAESADIRSRASIEAQSKIKQATSDALRIKGEGEAEVNKILTVLEKNPELATFLSSLSALESILGNRAG
jgi:membrane protease subunit HflC